ncbi:unnamed protein product [Protopolystoma xenopodis]|uniref:Uncharacterized protein n=1 Tax=Protopolystoma xenopodis TaxID=117903 RepID=A0A448WN62_9PLAT|nr:unnamed protein product [Protopolystoma xenopodis]
MMIHEYSTIRSTGELEASRDFQVTSSGASLIWPIQNLRSEGPIPSSLVHADRAFGPATHGRPEKVAQLNHLSFVLNTRQVRPPCLHSPQVGRLSSFSRTMSFADNRLPLSLPEGLSFKVEHQVRPTLGRPPLLIEADDLAKGYERKTISIPVTQVIGFGLQQQFVRNSSNISQSLLLKPSELGHSPRTRVSPSDSSFRPNGLPEFRPQLAVPLPRLDKRQAEVPPRPYRARARPERSYCPTPQMHQVYTKTSLPLSTKPTVSLTSSLMTNISAELTLGASTAPVTLPD